MTQPAFGLQFNLLASTVLTPIYGDFSVLGLVLPSDERPRLCRPPAVADEVADLHGMHGCSLALDRERLDLHHVEGRAAVCICLRGGKHLTGLRT